MVQTSKRSDNRGESRAHMNDFMGAISDYDKMIERFKCQCDNYKKRGIFKFNIQDFAGAEKDLTVASEMEKMIKKFFYFYGQIKSNQKEFDEAIECLTKALKIDNKYDGPIA